MWKSSTDGTIKRLLGKWSQLTISHNLIPCIYFTVTITTPKHQTYLTQNEHRFSPTYFLLSQHEVWNLWQTERGSYLGPPLPTLSHPVIATNHYSK